MVVVEQGWSYLLACSGVEKNWYSLLLGVCSFFFGGCVGGFHSRFCVLIFMPLFSFPLGVNRWCVTMHTNFFYVLEFYMEGLLWLFHCRFCSFSFSFILFWWYHDLVVSSYVL
jgi:hypothetical protein